MSINTAMCNSFKRELFMALHAFAASGGDLFKAAIYTASADLGKNTTVYTSNGEVVGQGYVAGGKQALATDPLLVGDIGFSNFQDVTWPDSTITGRGCLFYNNTNGDRAVSTHLFDSVKSSINGDFTIVTPANDASNALLRLV